MVPGMPFHKPYTVLYIEAQKKEKDQENASKPTMMIMLVSLNDQSVSLTETTNTDHYPWMLLQVRCKDTKLVCGVCSCCLLCIWRCVIIACCWSIIAFDSFEPLCWVREPKLTCCYLRCVVVGYILSFWACPVAYFVSMFALCCYYILSCWLCHFPSKFAVSNAALSQTLRFLMLLCLHCIRNNPIIFSQSSP